MTDSQRAAMQAALDRFEYLESQPHVRGKDDCYEDIIEEIRAALAEPQQKPVAWTREDTAITTDAYQASCWRGEHTVTPLYTTPPRREWVPLTDAEIKAQRWLLSGVKEYEQYTGREQLSVDGFEEFARAIEAALKEKNHD